MKEEFHATSIQLKAAHLLTHARQKKRCTKEKLAEEIGVYHRALRSQITIKHLL